MLPSGCNKNTCTSQKLELNREYKTDKREPRNKPLDSEESREAHRSTAHPDQVSETYDNKSQSLSHFFFQFRSFVKKLVEFNLVLHYIKKGQQGYR